MKINYLVLLGFLAFLQVTSADVTDKESTVLTSGLINDYADRTLELIRPAIMRNGFDPFKVDDISRNFWFKFLLVNYTGCIDLKNGWMQDLSTIRRNGNVTIKYEKKNLSLRTDLVVDYLMTHFDYSLKIFNLGPSGIFSARIKKQIIRFDILVDLERLTFELQEFALTRNDEVKVKLTGLGLVDPLLNIIVDALTAVFKNSITKIIGDQIKNALDELIQKLPPVLPPPPNQTRTAEILSVVDLLMVNLNSLASEESSEHSFESISL